MLFDHQSPCAAELINATIPVNLLLNYDDESIGVFVTSNLETEMPRLAAPVWLGHEFNNFLFATIGEDRHGLMLNVVSVLGRSNLDPWEEAASLARLPKELATQRLALLLDALPDPALQQGTDIVANRLIELLPPQVKPKARVSTLTMGAGATTHPRVLMQVLLIGIYMLCLLGTELVVSHFKSTHINTTHASDASTPAVQGPPATNH